MRRRNNPVTYQNPEYAMNPYNQTAQNTAQNAASNQNMRRQSPPYQQQSNNPYQQSYQQQSQQYQQPPQNYNPYQVPNVNSAQNRYNQPQKIPSNQQFSPQFQQPLPPYQPQSPPPYQSNGFYPEESNNETPLLTLSEVIEITDKRISYLEIMVKNLIQTLETNVILEDEQNKDEHVE